MHPSLLELVIRRSQQHLLAVLAACRPRRYQPRLIADEVWAKLLWAGTKPVDPLVGQAIQTCETLRLAQPRWLDRKTGEHVDMLFCVRATRSRATVFGTTPKASRSWL